MIIALSPFIFGCSRERTMHRTTRSDNWMDAPEILAVAFHPRREPASRPDGYEPMEIRMADGVAIGGRFYAAGTNAPTILFFHGNGEIVADYHDLALLYRERQLNFLPVDYRGYGLSTGAPTITAMLADARSIYAFARTWLRERGFNGRFIVMGRSLGSASALELAAARAPEVDGLILDSGFAHLVPLLNRLGASVPPQAQDHLVGQIEKMRTYSGPTSIIHGTQDFIIPISDAEDLYNASPSSNKRLLRVKGAGHNNSLAFALREYFTSVTRLAQGVVAET
jgi:fermentation-respiration switch protein FrsA (DUF1100 family)